VKHAYIHSFKWLWNSHFWSDLNVLHSKFLVRARRIEGGHLHWNQMMSNFMVRKSEAYVHPLLQMPAEQSFIIRFGHVSQQFLSGCETNWRSSSSSKVKWCLNLSGVESAANIHTFFQKLWNSLLLSDFERACLPDLVLVASVVLGL